MEKKSFSLLILLLVVFLVSFNACASKVETENSKTGKVVMTGHEPFARLTLMVADNEAYHLKCDDETKDILMKNQGASFIIEFSEVKEELKHKILIVTKATLLDHKGIN